MAYMKTIQRFLNSYWNKRIPVDPIAIAQAAGIEVRSSAHLNDFSVSSEDEGGLDGRCPVITYNVHDSLMRQRFAMAHALGHFAFGDI